jgi:hypothetical protein
LEKRAGSRWRARVDFEDDELGIWARWLNSVCSSVAGGSRQAQAAAGGGESSISGVQAISRCWAFHAGGTQEQEGARERADRHGCRTRCSGSDLRAVLCQQILPSPASPGALLPKRPKAYVTMPSHARWITEIEQLTDIDKFNAAPLLVHALADFVRKEGHSAVGAAHEPASRWRPCYIALTLRRRRQLDGL